MRCVYRLFLWNLVDILTLVFIRNHDVSLPTPTLYTCTQDQGCLPGLVIFLDNDDPRVVSTSLEVTKVWCECSKCDPSCFKHPHSIWHQGYLVSHYAPFALVWLAYMLYPLCCKLSVLQYMQCLCGANTLIEYNVATLLSKVCIVHTHTCKHTVCTTFSRSLGNLYQSILWWKSL